MVPTGNGRLVVWTRYAGGVGPDVAWRELVIASSGCASIDKDTTWNHHVA